MSVEAQRGARERTGALLEGPGARPPDLHGELRGAQLGGADLRGVDLTGRDLSGADLSGADLRRATLRGAILRGATLRGARLSRAELAGADLSDADLSGAVAAAVGFGRAVLRGALLFEARMPHASFVEADLRGADLRAAHLRRARFRGADLREASFGRSDLRGADLRDTQVEGACFREADLRAGRVQRMKGFERATFVEADIRDVHFGGAYMLRRHIMDEDFLYEMRSRSRWHRLLLWIWWVSSDYGRSALRWSFWTAVITVAYGFLYQLVDVDYGDHETWLSPFYFSLVTLTTLGYGDVLPASLWGQVAAMSEVVVGYLMLGGLISIFATKMARRAE